MVFPRVPRRNPFVVDVVKIERSKEGPLELAIPQRALSIFF